MIATLKEFLVRADRVAGDLRHRDVIRTALGKYQVTRDKRVAAFVSWESARTVASQIKYEGVNHLDQYLEEFTKNAEARGTKVHFASDAHAACDYILATAKRVGAKRIVKSKAMTGEEIHLNDALQGAGYEVVESDLGEYIVQLRHEPPYHFVFPAMHLTRQEISDLFQKELGTNPTNDPEELTMIARRVMRDVYCTADIGISGANFLVAETGMISITENEGNARLTTALPRVHVAIVGIEKVLPRLEDLALLLPMLATAGAGQPLTCYNSMIGGPRQEGEVDGPEEFHVVLIDNGRTRLLADPEQRDALHCIRCGACLNVCPIFKNVGGHTYGSTYQGPIGSVITPHFKGLKDWGHLSSASSLCGACTSACPVKIDIHHHLLHNRRNKATLQPKVMERFAFRAFGYVVNRPKLYAFATKIGRHTQWMQRLVHGTFLDPLKAWTRTRTVPPIAKQSFRDYWKSRPNHG